MTHVHKKNSALDTMAYHRNRDVSTFAHWLFYNALINLWTKAEVLNRAVQGLYILHRGLGLSN